MASDLLQNISASIELEIHKDDLDPELWRESSPNGKNIELFSTKSRIKLKKFSYPKVTVARNSDELKITYEFAHSEQFFISIRLNKLIISTPQYGQQQLLVSQFDDWIIASNSFASTALLVSQKKKIEIDPQGLFELLSLRFDLNAHTLIQGIKKLAENSTYEWTGNDSPTISHNFELEQLLNSTSSKRLKITNIDAKTCFESHFQSIKTAGSLTSWASCVSGGTDSAVATIHAALEASTCAIGVLLEPEELQQKQLSVIKKIENTISVDPVLLKARNIPLFEDMDNLLLADPYRDPYGNWSVVMALHLSDQGIDFIWNGLGADDYFSYFSGNSSSRKNNDDFSEVLQAPQQMETISHKRITPLPRSLSDGLLFYNSTWNNLGIWTETPFVTKNCISLALNVSKEQKIKKKFLKNYASMLLETELPEWDSKIHLSSAIEYWLRHECDSFEISSLHKALTESGIINLSALQNVLDSQKNGHRLAKSEVTSLVMILKCNRFLHLIDNISV